MAESSTTSNHIPEEHDAEGETFDEEKGLLAEVDDSLNEKRVRSSLVGHQFISSLSTIWTQGQRHILSPSGKQAIATSPTAWLNGLRGLSALIVFNFHYLMPLYEGTHYGFGVEGLHSFITLPIVRLLYDGLTSVCVFFVVGGYVCSLRSLQLMAADQGAKASQSLISSVFRRWFRLFLPVYVIMVATAILAYCGAFKHQMSLREADPSVFIKMYRQKPVPQKPILEQLHGLASDIFTISNPFFKSLNWPPHAPQSWTIPMEFHASMILYISLVGLGRCTSLARLFGLIGVAVVAHYYDMFWVSQYFSGAVIAQCTVMRQDMSEGLGSTTAATRTGLLIAFCRSASIRKFRTYILRPALYFLALFLMSIPDLDRKIHASYFAWTYNLVMHWLYRPDLIIKGYGCTLFVFLLATSTSDTADPNPTMFHRVFTSPLAQYLGRIMFSLYLVHLLVLYTFGMSITIGVWKLIGRGSNFTEVSGIFIGWALSLAATLFVARFFHRHVEARCVRFTSFVEDLCFKKIST